MHPMSITNRRIQAKWFLCYSRHSFCLYLNLRRRINLSFCSIRKDFFKSLFNYLCRRSVVLFDLLSIVAWNIPAAQIWNLSSYRDTAVGDIIANKKNWDKPHRNDFKHCKATWASHYTRCIYCFRIHDQCQLMQRMYWCKGKYKI